MTQKVVVGLDSSAAALTALSCSFEVASCCGGELEAVHVWLLQLPDPLPVVMHLPMQLAAIARSTGSSSGPWRGGRPAPRLCRSASAQRKVMQDPRS